MDFLDYGRGALWGGLAMMWVGGCGMTSLGGPRCARGLQAVEGQCVPVPTIVFRECVAAFRTTSIEREQGEGTAVGGAVSGYGSARVERERHDVAHTQFEVLEDADADAIIAECRRQEEAQRASQLDEAWAAADAARREADDARDDVQTLERSLAALDDELAEAVALAEQRQAALESMTADLEALRSLATADHPCAMEDWPRCAEAASADHEAGDYAEAHRRYALACDADVAAACGDWGLLYEHGLGVPVQRRRAVELYAQGCEGDAAEACAHLGVALHHDGAAPRTARVALQRACAGDVARGCTALGRVLEDRGEPDEDPVSVYARACELGDSAGCLAWGHRLEMGRGIELDLGTARSAYALACDHGDASGCAAAARLARAGRNPLGPSR
ncbi:MAG: tetratricopeptide repeat protein [Myxococcota bacterium]